MIQFKISSTGPSNFEKFSFCQWCRFPNASSTRTLMIMRGCSGRWTSAEFASFDDGYASCAMHIWWFWTFLRRIRSLLWRIGIKTSTCHFWHEHILFRHLISTLLVCEFSVQSFEVHIGWASLVNNKFLIMQSMCDLTKNATMQFEVWKVPTRNYVTMYTQKVACCLAEVLFQYFLCKRVERCQSQVVVRSKNVVSVIESNPNWNLTNSSLIPDSPRKKCFMSWNLKLCSMLTIFISSLIILDQ